MTASRPSITAARWRRHPRLIAGAALTSCLALAACTSSHTADPSGAVGATSSAAASTPASSAAPGTSAAAAGDTTADPTADATPPPPVVDGHHVLVKGVRMHVDDISQSAMWVVGHPNNPFSPLLQAKVASKPQSDWLGGWSGSTNADVYAAVKNFQDVARKAGDVRSYVIYNVPQRDCKGESAGGALTTASYQAWVNAVATGIGDYPAVIILEPDSLALIDCTDGGHVDKDKRFFNISWALDRFERLPHTAVYLDAGHSDWQKAPVIAARLLKAGIKRAQGFFLNVSNYEPTDHLIAFGKKVSALTGGAHFVLDTSRNGQGAWKSKLKDKWCNPPGRGLGLPPTLDTPDPLIDAYLWVKRPGESDGYCRGGPAAGGFFLEYTKGLVARAAF